MTVKELKLRFEPRLIYHRIDEHNHCKRVEEKGKERKKKARARMIVINKSFKVVKCCETKEMNNF